MRRNGRLETLLSPFQIRGVKLKNRMVKSPAATRYVEEDGYVTEKLKGFYESIARGGVGLVVFEAAGVDDTRFGIAMARIGDDTYIPGYSELVQGIHKHGCPTFCQLWHMGPAALETLSGVKAMSSSTLGQSELPGPTFFSPPRGLTIPEIEDMIEKYARAAERAQKAGFDGVEVHAAHSYLLASFLSRVWNRRQDIYGCQNMKNRTRIVVEIIKLIRERLGQDYPVGVRINGREWQTKNGITSEESQEIAQILQEAGVDYISVSAFGYGNRPFRFFPEQFMYPEPFEDMKPFVKRVKKPGIEIPEAASIKKVVSVPVIGVGSLAPELANWLLRKNKLDLVAFGRALFADSELPNKVASERLEDIAPCTHCMTCIEPTDLPDRTCRINPAMGEELKYSEHNMKPAEKKKRVMVVGGGTAGMEAARVAALRGHEVSLYERESKLGGLLPIAALVKGLKIEDLPAIIRYLSTQVTKLRVRVCLGKEVTLQLVEAIKPDVIILATGGIPAVPEIPGINRHNVISSRELHRKVKAPLRLFGPKVLRWLTKFFLPVGKKVLIMGGSMEGCQTAEFLVKRGRKVTIVETSDKLGAGIPYENIERLIPWFIEKGVAMFTGVKYEQITEKGLTLITKDGKRQTVEANTILVAMPLLPNNDLFQALQGRVPEVYSIGGSKGEGFSQIVYAIRDGRHIGCII